MVEEGFLEVDGTLAPILCTYSKFMHTILAFSFINKICVFALTN